MSFFETKVKKPIVDLLSSGVSPHALALSMAFGVTCGVFPIPGLTTVPVVIVVFLLGLNPVAAMLTNYLVTPLNIASVPVFVAYGNQYFGDSKEEFSVNALFSGLQEDLIGTLSQFRFILLNAIYMWAVFLLIATPLVYVVLYPILKCSMGSKATPPSAKKTS
ncbi:hypothetical protein H310_02987 [Aphanomyces invadans]|uniref:DUF2062 domain-containing protein n=1 Tax=Aphanomyces invadans TaxID=157072 RepID=A0A024UML1_9STRA|nr:hypothetical protein H310_02987 [Aphanomyces invadans]ETW06853.1 hypothetical protein H310_02987 [Aphanomyces invadans]|eukprot:XP_008864928.1 hypothetical protein H310_02987 [Aphanomyces invadans]